MAGRGRPRKNPVVETIPEKKTTKAKEEPKKTSTFSFGGMSKEERQNVILNALNPKPSTEPIPVWTVEETEYEPQSWVVVVTIDGHVYQEPVPRYCDEDVFIKILATVPDKPAAGNKYSLDVSKTIFEVKGVDCYITTSTYDGGRKLNSFINSFFPEKKGVPTVIGGNLIFSGMDKGLTKAQCKKVTEAIIKRLNTYEEKVDTK